MKSMRKLSNEELAAFCQQTSILLRAGVAPIESIRILLSDTEDAGSRALLTDISNAISKGSSFSEALESVGVFPDYVLNTLKLGEEAGSIDEVMSSLADYYERESQISESVKSAITYPLVMIVMMLAVIIILITKVLPIFNLVFLQLGSEMTGIGASLMNIGSALNSYSVLFLVILGVFFIAWFFFAKTNPGRHAIRRFASHFALTKKFYNEVAIERFSSGMALSLSSGLDTFESLNLVKNLVEHKPTEAKIDIIREAITKGDSFADGVKKAEIFSNVNNRMVAVGTKTGDIDEVMRHIADEYDRRASKRMNDLISVIEPTLVIVLSVIVGLILLSVIMPLMGIMASIG